MAFERLTIGGFQRENIGGGLRILFYAIDKDFRMPMIKGTKAFGVPSPGANFVEILLNGLWFSFDSKMEYRNRAEFYTYTITAKIPRNEEDRLRVVTERLRDRFVCSYYAMQRDFTVPGVNVAQLRILGSEENSCRLEFKESFGDQPRDKNFFFMQVECNMGQPAPYLIYR